MPTINITFAVKTANSTSNRISVTQNMSEDLYDSLHKSVYFNNGDAERWIKNNLFSKVAEIGIRDAWEAVSPMITKISN